MATAMNTMTMMMTTAMLAAIPALATASSSEAKKSQTH